MVIRLPRVDRDLGEKVVGVLADFRDKQSIQHFVDLYRIIGVLRFFDSTLKLIRQSGLSGVAPMAGENLDE